MGKIFIEAVNNELDSGWYTAFFFLIGLSLIFLVVICVSLCNIKNEIRYYSNGVLIYTQRYRRNERIERYVYHEMQQWYIDENCTILFEEEKMPNHDLKLYAPSEIYEQDQ